MPGWPRAGRKKRSARWSGGSRLPGARCKAGGRRCGLCALQQAAAAAPRPLRFSYDEGSVIGADSLHGRGGFDAAGMAERFAAPGIGVDANLADMLVVPASLARGKSRFVTPVITGHLETNLRVAAGLTGCRYGVGQAGTGRYEVVIDGSG